MNDDTLMVPFFYGMPYLRSFPNARGLQDGFWYTDVRVSTTSNDTKNN